MKKLIAGMDLHSNNVVIGLMDMDGKRVAHQKVECKLSQVLKFLAPWCNTTASNTQTIPTMRFSWPSFCG